MADPLLSYYTTAIFMMGLLPGQRGKGVHVTYSAGRSVMP